MNELSLPARIYVLLISLLGSVVLALNLVQWQSPDPIRFVCYLLVASIAAGLRVGVSSGSGGAMPVNILFVLIGIMELTLPETLLIGCVTTAIQCIQVLDRKSVV